MQWAIPAIGAALGMLFGRGGGGGGGGGGGITQHHLDEVRRRSQEELAQLAQRQQKALRAQQKEHERRFNEEQRRLREEYNAQIARAQELSRVEREESERRLQQQFEERMAAVAAQEAQERRRIQQEAEAAQAQMSRQLQQLQEAHQEAVAESQRLREALDRPIQARAEKIRAVNELRLPIRTTDKLAVLGLKGSGKSTFLWLLGESDERPQPALGDGTKRTTVAADGRFVDTIGAMGSDIYSYARLVVLMIFHGFPRDIILFTSSDRILHPISSLQALKVVSPMLVCMKSDMWETLNRALDRPDDRRNFIQIVEEPIGRGRVFRRIVRRYADDQEDPLSGIYHFEHYALFNRHGLGETVTHHTDLERTVADRAHAIGSPFQRLIDLLPTVDGILQLPEEGELDPLVEMLWRLIYCFHRFYQARDAERSLDQQSAELDFINRADERISDLSFRQP